MKKICLLAIMAMFLFGQMAAAPAEPESDSKAIAVWFGGACALLNSEGGALVEAGEWGDIFSLGNGLFAAGKRVEDKRLYAVMDETGSLRTEIAYEMLARAGDILVFRKNGLLGGMRETGEEIIEAWYTAIVSNGEDGYLALRTNVLDDESDQIYRIDPVDGECASDAKTLSGLSAVSDGRMKALSPQQNMYGYVNAQGDWAIEPQFLSAGDFQDGLAVVSTNRGTGLIDPDGNWHVQPIYREILRGDGFWAGISGKSIDLYDKNAQMPLRSWDAQGVYCGIVGEYLLLYCENEIQVWDANGMCKMQLNALASVAWGGGGSLVVSNGIWGEPCCAIYGSDGTPKTDFYQHILYLGDGEDGALYAFLTFDAEEYIDENLGETRYNTDADSVRYGLMDENGGEILPAEYLQLRLVSEKLLFAETEDVYGVMDLQGNWLYCVTPE